MGSSNIEDIKNEIVSRIHNLVVEGDYSGIVVENSMFEEEDYCEGGLYVRYRKVKAEELENVAILCRYSVCCYCKAQSIVSPVNPPKQSHAAFVKSVSLFKELSNEV